MMYKEFIKANFHKLPADLSAKEKMVKLAEMWHSSKSKTKSKSKKPEEGAGLFGSIGDAVDSVGSLFGLGLEKKHKAKGGAISGGNEKRKPGRPRKVKGGEFVGDTLANLFGGDVKQKQTKRKQKKQHELTHDELMKLVDLGRSIKQIHGGGFLDSFMTGLTLPFKVAANIPLPGLQEIGKVGTGVASALGL